jgi:glucose/arabinose dehydrogenase
MDNRMRMVLVLVGVGAAIGLLFYSVVWAQGDTQFLPLVMGGPSPAPIELTLETVVDTGGLRKPVDVANAGDDRLFIVEREGTIRIIEANGTVLSTPFLDIRNRVEWESNSERGLLGLAFHPDYTTNGYFYVNYTTKPDGDTHIARFLVTGDPDVADPASELVILAVDQPYANHNGGDLGFGPHDGYLYIALGDGGNANDPGNRAQDTGQLLGKLLRIDVDSGSGSRPADCGGGDHYRVPADNPLIGEPSACDEIWALGLRNPWRFSFDALSARIFIADVGQYDWEEVNVRPVDAAGENYGWRCYEGTHLNSNIDTADCEPPTAYTMPVFEYGHALGCAVTGGFVYRGLDYPALAGRYLFADYCSGHFWGMVQDGSGAWLVTRHEALGSFGFASFGEDAGGELYVANVSTGALYKIGESSGSEAP